MRGTTLDEPSLEISLVNELREIVRVAAQIEEFCDRRDIAPQLAYAVNLSIDELLTNTMNHGFHDDEPHRIEIIVRLEADTLVVIIVDDGAPFDPSRAPQTDITASLEDRPLGGLGLLLVHEMMDAIEYQRVRECNVVTLTKRTT